MEKTPTTFLSTASPQFLVTSVFYKLRLRDFVDQSSVLHPSSVRLLSPQGCEVKATFLFPLANSIYCDCLLASKGNRIPKQKFISLTGMMSSC